MVSLLILLVAMLGLLESVNLITRENIKDQMRDEAAQIAEDKMAEFRATPFGLITTNSPLTTAHDYAPQNVPSALRGFGKGYTVVRSATALASDKSVALGVRVSWSYNNVPITHELVSVRTN
jgi:type IV pilus assembly protein PilV